MRTHILILLLEESMASLKRRVEMLEESLALRESEIRYLSKMLGALTNNPNEPACTPYDEALAKLDHEFPGSGETANRIHS